MAIATKTRTKTASKTSTRGKPAATRTSRADEKPSGGMREEVNAYKRELILRAACETFYEHGYHDTTVDMLAERLSGTKAIFYYYYADKRAVLDEIYRRALAAAQAVAQVAIDSGTNPVETLRRFSRDYALWVIDNQRLVDVFWREERTLSRETRAEIAVEQKKFDELVARIIRDGVASGDFKVDDVQTSARAISGMISFIYTWWRPERRLSREEAGNYYAELSLRLAGVTLSAPR